MVELTTTLRRHGRIGLDTSPFIYHLEGTSRYATLTEIVFGEMERGAFVGLTSVLTLMELTVKPLQLSRPDVARDYETALESFPNLDLVPLDRSVARRAAELRAGLRLRPADALQVAACLEHGATALLTNDSALRRVDALEVILLDEYA
ncbi:MAG TPA: PIN domain-containing protein [Thermomicrobiaceae bacterium]|nr:PIN domain-containing protein [Thermomicrobiaceae bacterium]